MKFHLPLRFPLLVPAFSLLLLTSCIFTEGPVMGGFASKVGDPLGALEGEPAPTPPNQLMDPIIHRNGFFNFRWTEDLTKSSNNMESDPDDPG